MEIINTRFDNFKKFIKSNLNKEELKNDKIQLLFKIPVTSFLMEIRKKDTSDYDLVLSDILKTLNITRVFNEEVMNKLKLYIEYFSEIASTI